MPTWTATVAPGLEPVLARELAHFDLEPTVVPGHLRFQAPLGLGIALANRLHTPTRLLLQVGRSKAKTYEQLAQRVRSMKWGDYLRPRDSVEVSISSSGSRLRHRKAVEKKLGNAIFDSLRGKPLPPPRASRPRRTQRVQARLAKDELTVSIDVAGELLHRRGWRREAGKAPIRENLAAAMLMAAGWDPGEPLVDPFCGSGTVLIEAALIAAGRGPCPDRALAADAWPGRPPHLPQLASPPRRPACLLGADKHAPAISQSRNNARRAGVDVEWVEQEVSALRAPAESGLIVTNPPYGQRLGKSVRGVYAALGAALQGPFAGWRVAFLSPHAELASAVHPDAQPLTTFSNGGTRVGLYVWGPGDAEV